MHHFKADLHLHSRFSHATSPKLNAATLALWASVKGLQVIGTGDITHPQWQSELANDLVYDEQSGLFVLRNVNTLAEVAPAFGLTPYLAAHPAAPVYFMLQGEVSCVYKRGDKSRRVHNLVYLSTFAAAQTLSKKLAKIGNIIDDGRPILKLDSKDLLEMVLTLDDKGFVIPAHIWTPWYSLFGEKSGFSTLDGCFGALTKEIFAVETGLSSDPAMNRLWSALDGLTMVSNSDAHSPENLGREATLFAGDISYTGILGALAANTSARAAQYTSPSTTYSGTIEFYPEEGKYHMDGHRKCHQMLTPKQTKEYNGRCPVCGGVITVGVVHRIMELADRQTPRTDLEPAYPSLIPLATLWAEILGVSSSSKKAQNLYLASLTALGAELDILLYTPLEQIAAFSAPLSIAIGNMRQGVVTKTGGYDGEYGSVLALANKEEVLALHPLLANSPVPAKKTKAAAKNKATTAAANTAEAHNAQNTPLANSSQAVTNLPHADNTIPEGEHAQPLSNPLETVPPSKRKKTAKKPVVAKQTLPLGEGILVQAPKKRQPKAAAKPAMHQENAAQSTAVSYATNATAPLPVNDFTFSAYTESANNEDDFIFSTADEMPLALDPHNKPVSPQNTQSTLPLMDISEPKEAIIPLAPEQLAIVTLAPHPVLTLAGAGAGKSRMIAERIAHLLDDGIAAKRIIAITATRYAAIELDVTLQTLLGKETPLPRTDTLISFALELWHKVNGDIPILLTEDLAWQTFVSVNGQESPKRLENLWQQYTSCRAHMLPLGKDATICAAKYSAQKQAYNLADTYDLLEFWQQQIQAGHYVAAYGHVLVDEVHYLLPLEAFIIKALLAATGEGFFGMANPLLSTHWMLPNPPHAIAFFAGAYPALVQPSVTTNYRSALSVVECCNALAQHIPQEDETYLAVSTQQGVRPQQGNLHMFAAATGQEEREWMAERIQTFANQGNAAVLVRSATMARSTAVGLRNLGLQVMNPAGDSFWHSKRVQHIIHMAANMLGIATGIEQDPKTALCPDTVLLKGPLAAAAYLSTIPPFTADFWESSMFKAFAKAYEISGGWAELITWLALQKDEEMAKQGTNAIQVLTYKEVIGREFSRVFLPCFEDGLVPFAGAAMLSGKLSAKSAPSKDKELQLLYTALSRAKSEVYISYAAKRTIGLKKLQLLPSSFLPYLPLTLFTRTTIKEQTTRQIQQLSLLQE